MYEKIIGTFNASHITISNYIKIYRIYCNLLVTGIARIALSSQKFSAML